MPALEAVVDDLGPHFLVFAPGDPHLLEGLKGREDGPADPDRVHALRGCNDLDVDRLGDLLLDFLGQALLAPMF